MVSLSAAMRSRKILSGVLSSFETEKGQMPKAHVMFGNATIIIPFEEMGIVLPAEEQESVVAARLYVNGLLGAKIHFLVLGVDIDARVAVASRAQANKIRQRQILERKSRDGEYNISQGSQCTAQILHVTPRFVRIDVYGYETMLRIHEISNLWISDLKETLQVGEEHLVEITSLTRNEETGEVTSLRAKMNLNGDLETQSLAQGQTYTGVVTNWSGTSYYVRVSGISVDVRCPMDYMYEMRPLEINDEVRFFVRFLQSNGTAVGSIMKLLKKNKPTEW